MKGTIKMSNTELARESEIERGLEERTTQREAASRLGINQRHRRRILQSYRKEGAPGLVSKQSGHPSNRKKRGKVLEKIRRGGYCLPG